MNIIESNFKNQKIAEVLRLDGNEAKINYGYNSGGYESYIYFITKDSGTLSINTVIDQINSVDFNDEDDSQWFIVGYEINYENDEIYDDHTGIRIPSANDDE